MAQSMTDRRGEQCARIGDSGSAPMVAQREYEDFQRLTRVVRVAMGRLGGVISPWLDEGLLMGQGLVTLLEFVGEAPDPGVFDDAAVDWIISRMRTWARSSTWYHAAWHCRVAPLCSALAERGRRAADDRQIAGDLGLDEGRLGERYTEAGLIFGVSPELLLPEPVGSDGIDGLTAAISALPLEQRRLLTLYFEDELTFTEIGELMDVSPGRAQEIYGRAATSIRARVFGAWQAAGVRG